MMNETKRTKTIKWKVLIVTCAVTLLPILFGLAVWNQLPEQIAIHFNIHNEPDNFASKSFAVFGLPLMMLVFQVICCVITDFGFQRYSGNQKLEKLSKWMIPSVTVAVYLITLGYSMGWAIDIRRVAILLVSVMFLVLGNYLPKLSYVKHYNFPPEVAKKVNRFTGFGMVIMGILGLLSIFFSEKASVVWLTLLIPYGILTVVYTLMTLGKYKRE